MATDSIQSPKNRAGPVAESYAELQSLPALMDTVQRPPVPNPGSAWSAVRALYQAIEVVLVSLGNLGNAATRHARCSDAESLSRSLHWMVVFAKAWVDMAWRIGDIAPTASVLRTDHRLELRASPNWSTLQSAEIALAAALDNLIQDYKEPQNIIGNTIATNLLRYVMLERIGLERCATPDAPTDYANFVRPAEIRSAVLERELPGDTVFLQFRAAHQVPEILVDAVNNHIDRAIRSIQKNDLTTALKILNQADRLLDAVVLVANILVENLQTPEYHEIREYLGLTSGSHSVGIHFHLMRDLYPALKVAVANATRKTGSADPLLNLTQLHVRSLGLHIDRWRLAHLNLPRTNLGGAGTGTRSLTGSADALLTVGRMRDSARTRDLPHSARGFRATDWQHSALALADIEQRLLRLIANQTQARFPDVQQRSGTFAASSNFRPPPRRLVREDDRS